MPEEKSTKPLANIIWTGAGEVPHTISMGMEPVIKIPVDTAEARRGFYLEKAGLVIAQHDGFKEFKAKAKE